MTADTLKAPFPYFGGKATIAPRVWEQIGKVDNIVDAFCGSAALVLGYPHDNTPIVTLNDADGFIANFYRAVSADPDAVARWLDWPVNEIDLFARHVWLIKQRDDLARRLQVDPAWYDTKIAGWWCWGACAWIGTGWCSGAGPWTVEDGEIVNRQLPHLGNAGRGVNRQLPHLGDAGRGEHLVQYMHDLKAALRGARVACGDWRRVLTSSVTDRHGTTAILLDPPYGEGEQEYSAGGNADKRLAADVWTWAVANGTNPLLRIAVFAYDDGRALPNGWRALRWTADKGYQQAGTKSADNRRREVVYFSPACPDLNALPLFAALESEAA